MTDFAQIGTATLVWMILLSSLRFSSVSANALVPVGSAAWGMLWCKGDDSNQCREVMEQRLDALYIRLLAGLTSPASALLAYLGCLLIGSGCAIGSFGNVIRFVMPNPQAWMMFAQTLTCIGIPMIVVGMSCIIAAFSPRRTASLFISLGFILSGLGVAVIVQTMGHHA